MRSAVARSLLATLGLACLPFWSGCGQATYAERVNRTNEVYAYRNKLDQNLQGEWSRGDFGVSLRVPKPFVAKPAPPPAKNRDDGTVEVIVDERQPSYLGIELPGLLGAWEARNSEQAEGFIYVCSNHQRFVDAQGGTAGSVDPGLFLKDVEMVLQQGLQFQLSEEKAKSATDLNARYSQQIPTSDKFAPPKAFTSIRAAKMDDATMKPIMELNLYEYTNGSVQVAVILIAGPGTSPAFDQKLRLALETLKADSTIPKQSATGRTVPTGGGSRF